MSTLAETLSSYLESFLAERGIDKQRIYVAFSGGLDSTVLLHALNSTRHQAQISAIHVNHGLQTAAATWAEWAADFCQREKINCQIETIRVSVDPSQGLEASARQARYQIFARYLNDPQKVLLSAHHQNDQAETLLLHLLRGSGVRGLAAMRWETKLGAGKLLRPFLNFSRNDLLAYAAKHNLNWIEDPSNTDPRFARNYLRQIVVPNLEEKWPAAVAELANSAQYCREASDLLADLAALDWENCRGENINNLRIDKLSALTYPRAKNLLFYWLEKLNFSLPNRKKIDQILFEVAQAKIDANPELCWDKFVIRRFKNQLYALKHLDEKFLLNEYAYTLGTNLFIPEINSLVNSELKLGLGIDPKKIVGKKIKICFRRMGEKIVYNAQGNSHKVKKVFQATGIPNWLRMRIPFVYADDELIEVLGICRNYNYLNHDNSLSWNFSYVQND